MTETRTGSSPASGSGAAPAAPTVPKTPTAPPHARRALLRRPDVLIPVVLLGVFLVLWMLVLSRPDFLTSFDEWVRGRVQSVSKSPDDDKPHWPLIKHFSDLAGGVHIHKVAIQVPVATLAGVTLVATVWRRSWRPAAAAATGCAALAFVLMLKANGHRPGPGMGGKTMPGGLGYFPSGHTANTVLGYGSAALILAWAAHGRRARVAIATATALLTAAMGFALLWLDYHWLSDVVGSYALCGAALFAVARVLGLSWDEWPERRSVAASR